jgi:hypothetical protein
MFKELSDGLKLSILERTTSPLLGTFAGFWIVFNWQPIAYMLFEKASIRDKFDFIFSLEQNYIDPWPNLWAPILLTIGFVTAYPVLSGASYWLWERGTWFKNKVYQKIYKDKLLSYEDSLNLKTQINDIEKIHVEVNDKHKIENERLLTVIQDEKDNSKLISTKNYELATEAIDYKGHFKKLDSEKNDLKTQLDKVQAQRDDFNKQRMIAKSDLEHSEAECSLLKEELSKYKPAKTNQFKLDNPAQENKTL